MFPISLFVFIANCVQHFLIAAEHVIVFVNEWCLSECIVQNVCIRFVGRSQIVELAITQSTIQYWEFRFIIRRSVFFQQVVFMQKFVPRGGMGTLVSTMLPYTIVFAIVWAIMLVIWMAIGIPLGPGGGLTYTPGG